MNNIPANNDGRVPTIKEVIDCYRKIAPIQRMKTERPSVRTVGNVLLGVTKVCEAARIALSEPISVWTNQKFDKAIAGMLQMNLKKITVKSYLNQFRGLFARWCLQYYENNGWEIPPIKYPVFFAYANRYTRPNQELLTRLKKWYAALKGEYWFAATMMLEFAMRNGDVLRLKKENFVTKFEKIQNEFAIRHYLSYTPHKTANSSRRTIFWPIIDEIWQKFDDYGGLDGLDVTEETFIDINSELRDIGFRGAKASYELRKICIDRYYQRLGIEAAVAISGDSIKTVTWYYADPSHVNHKVLKVSETL